MSVWPSFVCLNPGQHIWFSSRFLHKLAKAILLVRMQVWLFCAVFHVRIEILSAHANDQKWAKAWCRPMQHSSNGRTIMGLNMPRGRLTPSKNSDQDGADQGRKHCCASVPRCSTQEALAFQKLLAILNE